MFLKYDIYNNKNVTKYEFIKYNVYKSQVYKISNMLSLK